MTGYGFAHSRQIVLPSQDVQEKKAARRKLLAAVERKRRQQYIRFMQKKGRLQTDSDLL